MRDVVAIDATGVVVVVDVVVVAISTGDGVVGSFDAQCVDEASTLRGRVFGHRHSGCMCTR